MNIIEILKKCPKGTKLYSPIFGECTLNKIISKDTFSVISNNSTLHFFFCDGRCTNDGECCIFPSKEERDWNKFQIPYVYKNGDIVYLKTKNGRKYVIIIKNIEDDYLRSHIDWWVGSSIWFSDTSFNIEDIEEHRFATETEKQKLFKELKVNGYKWNEESKTVEDLNIPKFKDGDILFVESVYPFIVIYKENENEECFYKYVAIKNYPDCTHIFDGNGPLCHKKGVSKIRFATKEEKQKLFQAIKEKGYRWNAETKTLEKLVEHIEDKGNISDGYHTFNELYEYRLLYNASMFNELAKQGLYDVHKSKRHSDGTIPFGDENWFIVQAELPT